MLLKFYWRNRNYSSHWLYEQINDPIDWQWRGIGFDTRQLDALSQRAYYSFGFNRMYRLLSPLTCKD